MYRRRTDGWLKHFDFILLDFICLQVSFCLAYWVKFGWSNPFEKSEYVALDLYLTMVLFLTALLGGTMSNILRRGHWKEAKSCGKTAVILMLMATLFLFSMKAGNVYSRIFVYMSVLFFLLSSYVVRITWKWVIRTYGSGRRKESVLIAANTDQMMGVLAKLHQNSFDLPRIRGLILLDGEPDAEGFPYPVVANGRTMTEYITRNWVDELLIQSGEPFEFEDAQNIDKELETIADSGVAVHKILFAESEVNGREKIVERIGGYIVLTDSIRIVSLRQAVLKRCLDIAGGLVGCIIAGLILIVVGPLIYIQSPGSIIFKQTRIGRNGKPFTIYKIRSMCLNADALKKELVAANRVSDGMMFKLDCDPRIIGSKVMPDGSYRKGIGNVIRDYSLDEFPQFFNVLKGDMSLVGTRPPTLDEWEKYSPHHRARMTFRPGITGMWQISGRSNITDFDEVINLDMQYISNWSAGMDFRILLKTLMVVLNRSGAK